VEFVTKPLPVSVNENVPVEIGDGATEVRTGIGFCNVTVLVPFCVVSAALVAVTVIVFGVGRLAGAVYIPFESIVPVVALPPATEFTDQVTLVFVAPLTTAANDSFDPTRMVAVAGVTATEVLPLSGGKVGEPLPLLFVLRPVQPLRKKINIADALQMRFTDMIPLGRRQLTVFRTTADCGAVRVFYVQLLKGVGRCCLGRVRVENASGTGYWPGGQNEVNGLRPSCGARKTTK
jgi:hypothetical protein